MNEVRWSWADVESQVDRIVDFWRGVTNPAPSYVYAVPNGGCVPGALVAERLELPMLDEYQRGLDVLVIDDLIDSGATMRALDPLRADVLAAKAHSPWLTHGKPLPEVDGWITFPWETNNPAAGPTDAVVRLLEWVGEDPTREGLRETPRRVTEAYRELCGGYELDPEELLARTFPTDDRAEGISYDEMVVVGPVEFSSLCEHHLMPFSGVAWLGYIPSARVVGLSKLARLVDVYARRLQVQERLTAQLGQAMVKYLAPRGVGVIVDATHACMSCRGVKQQRAKARTSFLDGYMRVDPSCRTELFALARNGHLA